MKFAIGKLDSRHTSDRSTERCLAESQLNIGKYSKKCKLHHEHDDVSNETTILPSCPHVPFDDVSVTDEMETIGVPPPAHSIIENQGLSDLITKNLVYHRCKLVGSLLVSFPSLGVTTIPRVHCSSCDWTKDAVVSKTPMRCNYSQQSVMDYDTNIKFCLSFMSGGEGGCDAQRLLAFLSLPSATTFGKLTFLILERAMTDSIFVLTEWYLK